VALRGNQCIALSCVPQLLRSSSVIKLLGKPEILLLRSLMLRLWRIHLAKSLTQVVCTCPPGGEITHPNTQSVTQPTGPVTLSSNYSGSLVNADPSCSTPGTVNGTATVQIAYQGNSTMLSMSGSASIQGGNDASGTAQSDAGINFAVSAPTQYVLSANGSNVVAFTLCGNSDCILNATTPSVSTTSTTGTLTPGNWSIFVYVVAEINVGADSASANFSFTLTLGSPSCKANVVSWKQFNDTTTGSTWGSKPYDNSYETQLFYSNPNSIPVSPNGQLTLTDGINSCPINLVRLGLIVRSVSVTLLTNHQFARAGA
jgi:hypothetical protein